MPQNSYQSDVCTADDGTDDTSTRSRSTRPCTGTTLVVKRTKPLRCTAVLLAPSLLLPRLLLLLLPVLPSYPLVLQDVTLYIAVLPKRLRGKKLQPTVCLQHADGPKPSACLLQPLDLSSVAQVRMGGWTYTA